MKRLIFFITVLALCFRANCQTKFGEIHLIVLDSNSQKPIEDAFITLNKDNAKLAMFQTDSSGVWRIKALQQGMYSVRIAYAGYIVHEITNIEVDSGKITEVRASMRPSIKCLSGTKITRYKLPIISPDGVNGTNMVLKNQPSRNVNGPTFRGARSAGTAYYVDGVRVIGGAQVPRSAISNKRFRRSFQKNEKSPSNQPKNKIDKSANTEQFTHIIENEFLNAKAHPLSTVSIDVDKASYSLVRGSINRGVLPNPDEVRIEELINYFKYDYKDPKNDEPFSVSTELTVCPWNKKHQLLQFGMKSRNVDLQNMPSNNLVFLLDVSGSMGSPDRLPLLKQSLKLLVEQLRVRDKVSIVVYAGNAGLVLPCTSGKEKDKILQAIDRLESGGSTAGGAGIDLAYKVAKKNFIADGNNRIVLATDGDFNVGVSSISDLEKLIEEKRKTNIFLTVLGFGYGNTKDNTMETLADKGNGNYAYIDNLNEGKKVLVKELGGTLLTVAKDVKVQIEFNPKLVGSYRLIGYENRRLNDEDFNNDAKDAGDMGAGHSVTMLYELIPAGMHENDSQRVDELKYQQIANSSASNGNELLTLKIRYKQPNKMTSVKQELPMINHVTPFDSCSINLRFASALIEYGQILRGSKYTGGLGYSDVLKLAEAAKGTDEEGYRAEFLNLVKSTMLLSKR